MAADGEIALGQCFVGGRLYYTTPGPSGSSGLWFCSTAGLERFQVVAERYPEAVSADFLAQMEVQAARSRNLAPRAWASWSVTSREEFLKGTVACDTKNLFQRLRSFIMRFHWAPEPGNYDLLATFVMSTYLYTVADAVPSLHLMGDPDCGKTRVAEIVQRVAFKPLFASDLTAPVLFRWLALIRSVLILDEQEGGIDPLVAKVLRASYRLSGTVFRSEARVPTSFRCFSPKLLVSNTKLLDEALASRFIPYRCERAPHPVDKLLDRSVAAEGAALRDDLHVFALRAAPDVAGRYSDHPHVDGVSNRDEEIATLLWAVAAYVDAQPGPSLALHERVVELMKNLSDERARGRELDGERSRLRFAIRNFLIECGDKAVNGIPGYYLAEDFVRYANASGELECRIPNTKIASEKLGRYGLLADRKRVDIETRGAGQIPGIPTARPCSRIQRTAFRFAESQPQRP